MHIQMTTRAHECHLQAAVSKITVKATEDLQSNSVIMTTILGDRAREFRLCAYGAGMQSVHTNTAGQFT
jgi:hypothetical protein